MNLASSRTNTINREVLIEEETDLFTNISNMFELTSR
jgi:hypothetical protein